MVDDGYIIENFYRAKKYKGRPDTLTLNKRKLYSEMSADSELAEYIGNRFSDSESVEETLYRIRKGIFIKPVCPVCGRPICFKDGKFKKYCSVKCVNNDPAVRLKIGFTNIEKYGVSHPLQSFAIKEKVKDTNIKKYGCIRATSLSEVKEKVKATCNERFGSNCFFTSDTFRDSSAFLNLKRNVWSDEARKKRSETCMERYNSPIYMQSSDMKVKSERTCMKKYGCKYVLGNKGAYEKAQRSMEEIYGVSNCSQLDTVKDKKKVTTALHYGCENPMQSEEIKRKTVTSKRVRGTFNTSSDEETLAEMLLEKFGEVIRQYRSGEYSFACDFYVPSENLYIEYNGTWTHGGHPFDPLCESDIEKLAKWEERGSDYYKNAIRVWTESDPLKRKAASENHLNYKELWSISDAEKWLKDI